MKKLLSVILVGLMILSFAACSSDGKKTQNDENIEKQTEAVQNDDFEKLKTAFQKKTFRRMQHD
mgnify:CR=1 FL=1